MNGQVNVFIGVFNGTHSQALSSQELTVVLLISSSGRVPARFCWELRLGVGGGGDGDPVLYLKFSNLYSMECNNMY